VIPSPTVSLAAGGTSISGTVPAGLTGTLIGDYRCDVNEQPVPLGAGAFSVPRVKIVPGQLAQLAVSSSQGDVTSILAASPGETPCITISAVADVLPPPGAPAPAGSYNINIDHLLSNHGQSVRVVARRGSTAYFDQSADSPYLSTNSTTKPLPGDVVDVYRPKTAPTPSYSQTIPQVSAKFDAAVDLIAVDTPAGGVLRAYACRTYTCGNENARGLRDFVAGRKVLNFGASEGSNVAIDLHPTDIVNVYFTNADFSMSYAYQALPGDLVAPTASFKLPSKLKISSLVKSLKKGYKLKLSSTEAGTASLKLGKLASISKPVKVGSNTFYLKFSKSGKKQIKKLAKKGKKAKPLTVSLTSVVTDASGNAATVTKSTKIKP
jgi:hypothetical protein